MSQAPPALFDPSLSVKIAEVAKKYDQPAGEKIDRIPEYTIPGGPNNYHCSKIETSWTQGFFPGLIWLLVERRRLDPASVDPRYTEEELVRLARRWQADFEHHKRPALNHDQGFRFQLSFGKDYALTGNEHAKEVMIEACESLVDRYSEGAGCIRSWDKMVKTENPDKYTEKNTDEHFLVIIDNMMNLDMMFEATKLTGDNRYAAIGVRQAEKSSDTHVRPDHTTYHVVNFDQKTGTTIEKLTHQGYADESCWARGQAWGIYGYAQCALRAGRTDFRDISAALAEKYLSLLGPSGVAEWDFTAPKPCPYDASANTIAARGMQMLYQLYLPSDPKAAQAWLERANKVIADTLAVCGTGKATLGQDGKVNWGEGGWETILKHSTINGNDKATRRLLDHGLVYADYYLMEFGNEALKIQAAAK